MSNSRWIEKNVNMDNPDHLDMVILLQEIQGRLDKDSFISDSINYLKKHYLQDELHVEDTTPSLLTI